MSVQNKVASVLDWTAISPTKAATIPSGAVLIHKHVATTVLPAWIYPVLGEMLPIATSTMPMKAKSRVKAYQTVATVAQGVVCRLVR